MITMRLSGGLGNQMFQFAAGLAVAKSRNTELSLDLSEFSYYDLRNYMLDCYTLSPRVSILDKVQTPLQRVFERFIPNAKIYKEQEYYFESRFTDLKDGRILEGYFQSPKYFENSQKSIRESFTLKSPLSKNSQDILTQIQNSNVAISLHIRRGDYVNDPQTQNIHGEASEVYYQNAMDLMRQIYGEDNITFFIFSDDHDYVVNNFKSNSVMYAVEGNGDHPHEDMALMSKCDHHILANSSFSWWGAWLNASNDKTVIAPKLWFARQTLIKKSIIDLCPEGWISL